CSALSRPRPAMGTAYFFDRDRILPSVADGKRPALGNRRCYPDACRVSSDRAGSNAKGAVGFVFYEVNARSLTSPLLGSFDVSLFITNALMYSTFTLVSTMSLWIAISCFSIAASKAKTATKPRNVQRSIFFSFD